MFCVVGSCYSEEGGVVHLELMLNKADILSPKNEIKRRHTIEQQIQIYKQTQMIHHDEQIVKYTFNVFVCVSVCVCQAEAWIKGKLQDLKDGCNIQRCPLQDWEEASQTLQRDLKDFENTLIQLNQVTK